MYFIYLNIYCTYVGFDLIHTYSSDALAHGILKSFFAFTNFLRPLPRSEPVAPNRPRLSGKHGMHSPNSLCMCVCVCVCMYVCMCVHVCIDVCMYVLMYVYICMCMHVCMYVCMCVYVCVCVCIDVCMYVYVYVCVCVCMYVCMCG